MALDASAREVRGFRSDEGSAGTAIPNERARPRVGRNAQGNHHDGDRDDSRRYWSVGRGRYRHGDRSACRAYYRWLAADDERADHLSGCIGDSCSSRAANPRRIPVAVEPAHESIAGGSRNSGTRCALTNALASRSVRKSAVGSSMATILRNGSHMRWSVATTPAPERLPHASHNASHTRRPIEQRINPAHVSHAHTIHAHLSLFGP